MTSRHQLIVNENLLEAYQQPILGPDDCDRVIASHTGQWRSARIVRDGAGNTNAVESSTRSVLTHDLVDDEHGFPSSKIIKGIRQANEAHYRFDLRGILAEDGLSVLRYEAGTNDHYRPHRDYGPEHAFRKLTVVVQLTPADDYLGGDLVLEGIGQLGSRQQGTLIVFPSFLTHTVTPVMRGVRHCIVGWVHGPSFR